MEMKTLLWNIFIRNVDNMIYTSYFGNIKKISKENDSIIFFSIAGKAPDWYENAKTIQYKKFSIFAPKYNWWKEWHDEFKNNLNSVESIKWYKEKYLSTILEKIDVKNVVEELNKQANGKDVCLLCYETPNNFCHRKLVREWLNENGIECHEK